MEVTMQNENPPITGYRQLSAAEVELVNAIKEMGRTVGFAVEGVEHMPEADQRAAAIAKTHLQTGLMWLVRAITRPQGF
jgi:hypothetical protein